MLSKQYLKDYIYCIGEIDDVEEKIARLERDIAKVEERIREIEANDTVKDKVYGGDGGEQGFVIEGIPTVEYGEKKNLLTIKSALLHTRKSELEILRIDLVQRTKDVEMFIASVNDAYIRRIINLRYIKRMTWKDVAIHVGGGNSEDTVRKALDAFLKNS